MTDLYYCATPNGLKMMVPYRLIHVDIGKGDQFKPDFQPLDDHPHLKRWFETIARRPERKVLFGTGAAAAS